MGPTGCPETSAHSCQHTLRDIPEKRKPQIKLHFIIFANNAKKKLHNTGRFITYSGITKIYFRKAVHVFTKPVQIEGTTQNFFPSKLFFIVVHISAARRCEVCSEKMAAPREKSFCVLEHHTSKSVITVQRAFRAKYSSHHCHVTSLT
jgi:hypothetical protein